MEAGLRHLQCGLYPEHVCHVQFMNLSCELNKQQSWDPGHSNHNVRCRISKHQLLSRTLPWVLRSDAHL